MPTRQAFPADAQGCRFKNEVDAWPVDFSAILAMLDEPNARSRLVASSIAGRPALAGVIAEIEERADVDAYFRSTEPHDTRRFRQAVGVAIRLAMEDLGWRPTGRKGSLGRRVRTPAGTIAAGAHDHHPPEAAMWFAKAEIYEPMLGAARGEIAIGTVSTIRPGLISAGKTPEERVALFERFYDRIESIGTPEERAETCDFLMKALAESRRAEARVF